MAIFKYKGKNQAGNVVEGEPKVGILQKIFGSLHFFLYPIEDVHYYFFQWTGLKEGGEVNFRKKRALDYILLKDYAYWFKADKVLDKKLLPLEVEVVMTLRIINPYKALFSVEYWLDTIISRSRPAVRDAITGDIYEKLIKKTDSVGRTIYNNLEDKGLLKEFKERYGVEIRKTEVKEINPPEEHVKYILKEYFAKIEAKANVAIARGKKEVLRITGEGEAQRINAVYSAIQKFGGLGELIKTLESVEKSPLAASLAVQAVPGLPEALKGIFSKESLNKKDIKDLVDAMKKK